MDPAARRAETRCPVPGRASAGRPAGEAPRAAPRPAAQISPRNVAAEINYHTNEPDPAFFACCLEEGAKISLGSDSHLLYEVADFHPHLRLLRQVAGDTNLEDVLFRL